jgi:gamma-glutamyl-gamma-aminobutyrate hydrolase PuuD
MKKAFLTPYIFENNYKKLVFSTNLEWIKYLKLLGFITSFGNPLASIDVQLKNKDLVIISGGGDIHSIKKSYINLYRDNFEKKVIATAIKKKIPILAVCRGFQLVSYIYTKNKKNMINTKNHSNKNHFIYMLNNNILLNKEKLNVNSYHEISLAKINKKFDILAISKDKNIEIAYSNKLKILGLMFHPERKNLSQKKVNLIINNFLKKK